MSFRASAVYDCQISFETLYILCHIWESQHAIDMMAHWHIFFSFTALISYGAKVVFSVCSNWNNSLYLSSSNHCNRHSQQFLFRTLAAVLGVRVVTSGIFNLHWKLGPGAANKAMPKFRASSASKHYKYNKACDCCLCESDSMNSMLGW